MCVSRRGRGGGCCRCCEMHIFHLYSIQIFIRNSPRSLECNFNAPCNDLDFEMIDPKINSHLCLDIYFYSDTHLPKSSNYLLLCAFPLTCGYRNKYICVYLHVYLVGLNSSLVRSMCFSIYVHISSSLYSSIKFHANPLKTC